MTASIVSGSSIGSVTYVETDKDYFKNVNSSGPREHSAYGPSASRQSFPATSLDGTAA